MSPDEREQRWQAVRLELLKKLSSSGRDKGARNGEIRSEAVERLTRSAGDPQGCSEEVHSQLVRMTDAECRQIERALTRGDAGLYGICSQCEEEIGERRLDAIKEVTVCVECASGRRQEESFEATVA